MNSKMIIGIVVAVVLIGGGIYYFTSSSDDGDGNTNSDSATEQQQADELSNSGDPAIPATLVFEDSYTAVIKTSNSDDPSRDGTLTMRYKNPNLWAINVQSNEGNIQTIYTGDASYVGGPTGWTKFPIDASEGASIEGYTFSDSDFDSIRQYANYLGKQPCSLGQCDVWEAKDNTDGVNGTIWIGPDGGLSKAIVISGPMTTEIEYDYDAALVIEIPKDFQEFNFPSGQNLDLESLIPQ